MLVYHFSNHFHLAPIHLILTNDIGYRCFSEARRDGYDGLIKRLETNLFRVQLDSEDLYTLIVCLYVRAIK